MCLLPPSKSILVARTVRSSISLCSSCLAVSRRLAWAPEVCASTLVLLHAQITHAQPRLSILQPAPRPIATPHPQSTIALTMCTPRGRVPPPSHSKLWKRGQLNMYMYTPHLHVCTCTWFATPSHTHMHACIHPDVPHLPYQELLTHKQRNKH